jgi:hypothetical protein
MSTSDRRVALHVARSLQSQLFFYEVEWGGRVLQDNVADVYMFLDDQEGPSDAVIEELPTGVITMLTRCYAPMCGEGGSCYSYACPRMVCQIMFSSYFISAQVFSFRKMPSPGLSLLRLRGSVLKQNPGARWWILQKCSSRCLRARRNGKSESTSVVSTNDSIFKLGFM